MCLWLYSLHGWLNLEPLFKVLWWQNHPLLWRKNGLRKFRSGNLKIRTKPFYSCIKYMCNLKLHHIPRNFVETSGPRILWRRISWRQDDDGRWRLAGAKGRMNIIIFGHVWEKVTMRVFRSDDMKCLFLGTKKEHDDLNWMQEIWKKTTKHYFLLFQEDLTHKEHLI